MNEATIFILIFTSGLAFCFCWAAFISNNFDFSARSLAALIVGEGVIAATTVEMFVRFVK